MKDTHTGGRQRILVVARGHLGDLVAALPALRDLRRGLPQARITVMVNEYLRGALDGCPYVDRVIYVFAYRRRRAWERRLRGLALVARSAARFDLVVALRWSPRLTPAFALLIGARTRIGYHRPHWASRLLTHDLGPERIDEVPNRLLNLAPVAAVGVETSPAYSAIDWLSSSLAAQTTALLEIEGLASSPFAAIHLSSHWGCNQWSSRRWAEVADRVASKHRLRIVFTGTNDPVEQAKLAETTALMRRPYTSLLGRTTISQLFDVTGRASLVLACDGPLTQIALAQRTPAVILFGIEPVASTGPLPGEDGVVMETIQHWQGLDRAPAPNSHCRFGERHCQTAFCRPDSSRAGTTVAEVMSAVERVLSSASTRSEGAPEGIGSPGRQVSVAPTAAQKDLRLG